MIGTGRIAGATLALALGCGGAAVDRRPSPFDVDDPAAQPAPPEAADQEQDLPVVYAVEPDAPAAGVIEREALHRVLAAGPGAYARSVMIEAVVDGGKLRGWRVTRWEVPWRGLARGEVVVDVNGVAIVRPGDLIELWESLWDASEIAIRVQSDGGEEIRRFPVR